MNYFQAQNILDEVREGANYSEATIKYALELTGDLPESVSRSIATFDKTCKNPRLETIRLGTGQRT